MFKTGLLLPRSTYYASIGFDMYEGFQASLRQMQENNIQVITENIGFGTDQQNCYRAAERMLMQDNVSVVFAYISHRIAQVLRPLFLAANKILVVLDSGANLPQEWPTAPNVFYLSLQNALGNVLAARQAQADGFKHTAMVTGYYDGGYLHTYAAFLGHTLQGGQVVFNHATGYKREGFSMQGLKDAFQNLPVDTSLHAIFSADYVQWYFEELQQHFPQQELPVYLPPFALEEGMLKDAVYPGKNVKGIAAWARSLDNEQNHCFKKAMEETGREANLFSLLGWEAAIIALQLKELMKEHKNNGREAAKAFEGFSFNGPRGKVSFRPGSRHSIAPLYRAKVEATAQGTCMLSGLQAIDAAVLEQAYEQLSTSELNNALSGWHNSYACI